MPESYCRSCYRELRNEAVTCSFCAADRARLDGRPVLVVGLIGLPILLLGMLTFNLRLCLIGGIIAGCAAIVYAVIALR